MARSMRQLKVCLAMALAAIVWSSSTFVAPQAPPPRVTSPFRTSSASAIPSATHCSQSVSVGTTLMLVGVLPLRRKYTQLRALPYQTSMWSPYKNGYDKQFSAGQAKKEEKWWMPEKQAVPVFDFSGNMVGQDYVQFRRISKHTANYAVWQVYNIWEYQMKEFPDFFPRRKDAPKGRKMWKNKGVGKARMSSIWSTLWGKTSSNRPHGYDDKKFKKIEPQRHHRAISTVLQSKWKRMRVVDGLEDWGEAKYYKFRDMLENVTGVGAGLVETLVIARNARGGVNRHRKTIDQHSYKSALFMAGHLIPRLHMRTPDNIDPRRDGLKRLLHARRVIISREALHDLHRKYGAEDGWAFRHPRRILADQLKKLEEEYPFDREAEYETARALPASSSGREKWAAEKRKQESQAAIA